MDPTDDSTDDAMTEPESSADVVPPETEEETGAARWRPALPVAVTLVLVTIAAVTCGAWLVTDPPDTQRETEKAERQDVLLAGERFAGTMTSFDATKAQQYVDSLSEMLIGGKDSQCWSEVAKLVPAVADPASAQAATKRKQTYQGAVVSRAVETLDPDSARAMLVVDFATSAVLDKKRVPLASQRIRLRLDMATRDDGWGIKACTIVLPKTDEGGGK